MYIYTMYNIQIQTHAYWRCYNIAYKKTHQPRPKHHQSIPTIHSLQTAPLGRNKITVFDKYLFHNKFSTFVTQKIYRVSDNKRTFLYASHHPVWRIRLDYKSLNQILSYIIIKLRKFNLLQTVLFIKSRGPFGENNHQILVYNIQEEKSNK